MVRSLIPTDTFGLVYFTLKARPNEAKPRDQVLRPSSSADRSALWLDMLSAARRQATWVASSRGRIVALVSSRQRAGASAWEVDRLLAVEGAVESCQELLEKLTLSLGAQGVQRLFLRIPTDSPFASVAKKAGFSCYQTERLYRGRGNTAPRYAESSALTLRYVAEADEYALFRLYSTAVPADVRAAEGMTLQEWKEARERVRKHTDLVLEQQGCIKGWLSLGAPGASAYIDLLTTGEQRTCDDLLDFALAKIGNLRQVYALVPGYNILLERALLGLHFEVMQEFAAYAKPVTAKERVPCFLPVGA